VSKSKRGLLYFTFYGMFIERFLGSHVQNMFADQIRHGKLRLRYRTESEPLGVVLRGTQADVDDALKRMRALADTILERSLCMQGITSNKTLVATGWKRTNGRNETSLYHSDCARSE
jgi:hypothetical protein